MLHPPVARSRARGTSAGSPAAAPSRSPVKSAETPGAHWKHLSLRTSTVGETARAGTRGGGEPLPFRDRLASSFGTAHDLSSITAHVGGESAASCRDLGAKAYATGSSIAFGSSPDLWLAAHETAHVLQQRGGLEAANAPNAARQGDHREAPAERRADAIADRVVAGRSAADLLPARQTRAGETGAAVQRYKVEPVGGNPKAQVGEGRQTALVGSQSLYAAPGLVASANTKLQNAGKQGSYIELRSEGGSVTVDGNPLTGVQPHFLAKPGSPHSAVEGANAPGGKDTEGTADGPIALWTDCGRASSTVTGSQGGGDRSVVYKENGVAKVGKGVDDPSVSGWLKGEPNKMANQVYMDLLPGFIQRPDNAGFLVEGVHFDKRGFSVGRAIVGGIVGAVVGTLAAPGLGTILGAVGGAAAAGAIGSADRVHRKPKTILEAKMMYLALGNAGMDKFDKEAGINHYANPEVGESYSMATEGDMPGFDDYGKSPWNYHWAGVVMKDGGDNVTLENYAVTKAYAASKGVAQRDFIDRKWNFAMYGTADKDQTFHKEHLDSQTHGSKATSIVVRTDK